MKRAKKLGMPANCPEKCIPHDPRDRLPSDISELWAADWFRMMDDARYERAINPPPGCTRGTGEEEGSCGED